MAHLKKIELLRQTAFVCVSIERQKVTGSDSGGNNVTRRDMMTFNE